MKNNILYLLLLLIGLTSCEDKMSDEYNQLKKDIEQLKSEKEKVEEANKKLTEKHIEIAKKHQQKRFEKFIYWYVDFYVLGSEFNIDRQNYSIKNHYKNEQIESTTVYYNFFKNIRTNNYDNFRSLKQTIDHNYDENGLLLESKASDFNLLWKWNDDLTVNITFLMQSSDNITRLVSDKNMNIISYEYSQGEYSGTGKYEYNEAGLITKKEVNSSYNNCSMYYKYDKNNKLIEAIYKDSDWDEDRIYTLNYDTDNRLTKIHANSDFEKNEEIEITYSYVDGFTETIKNITEKETKEIKYKDISKAETLYVKNISENGFSTYTYDQNIFKSLQTEYKKKDGTTRIFNKVATISDNKINSYWKEEIIKDESNTITSHEKHSYTDIVLKEERTNKMLEPHINEYRRYTILKEALTDGVLEKKYKHRYRYYKRTDGTWASSGYEILPMD